MAPGTPPLRKAMITHKAQWYVTRVSLSLIFMVPWLARVWLMANGVTRLPNVSVSIPGCYLLESWGRRFSLLANHTVLDRSVVYYVNPENFGRKLSETLFLFRTRLCACLSTNYWRKSLVYQGGRFNRDRYIGVLLRYKQFLFPSFVRRASEKTKNKQTNKHMHWHRANTFPCAFSPTAFARRWFFFSLAIFFCARSMDYAGIEVFW